MRVGHEARPIAVDVQLHRPDGAGVLDDATERRHAGLPLHDGAVDLTRLIMDAVNDAHRVDPERRWRMGLAETPVVVRGDEHRLHQAVANLLANASTHTPPGTTVTTSLSEDPAAGTATVTVHDDGPGIPDRVLPHVFDRFAQGQYVGGPESGLGLSIVEAIARAHHGTVSVRSRPGETAFTLTVPMHPPSGRPG